MWIFGCGSARGNARGNAWKSELSEFSGCDCGRGIRFLNSLP